MDINRNAFRIVQSLTEQKQESSRARAARKGGRAGGPARASRLSPEERRLIAQKANAARWQRPTG
jgi:hypothetical protein